MLQSLDTTSLNRSNTSLSSVTPSTPTTISSTTSSSEEKQQRRRSTFYVPLVIEDDEPETSGQHNDEVDKSSTSGSLSSLASHSTSSKDLKNSSNINLKKSSSTIFKPSSSKQLTGSPRSATTSVKVTTLLFERANSTLGFSTTSSNSSTASSGYRSGSSKSSKKMAPPCGFNWSLSGVTDDMSADLDDDSDAAEFIIAMHKNKTPKSTITNTPVKETSSTNNTLNSNKRSSKTSLSSAKTTSTNRLSSISNKSLLQTNASNNHSTPIAKQRAQSQSTARTKRYGIVLNGLDDSNSPRSSLGSTISEQLNTTEARKSSSSYKSSNSNKWPSPAPRTQFNEENDIVVTPNTTSSIHTQRSKTNTKQTPIKMRDNSTATTLKSTPATPTTPIQNCNTEYDDDDDSEISRMQTNTSTPIKMMKSRSRTNILSVPSNSNNSPTSCSSSQTSSVSMASKHLQSSEQNLINVAKIKASTSTNTNTKQNTNTSITTTTPTKTISNNMVTSTPCVLRIKAKTLPQNLSPSVALKQGEALDHAASTSTTVTTNNIKSKKSPLETSASLNRKFGGSQACHLNRDSAKNAKTNTIITTAFPPKNLFLLKSTPKLTNSMSSNSDNSLTSPPNANNTKNYPPHPHQITSPAKKSLSFIRRAHSTKLSRSNSLLKSIASQHQQQMHGPNTGSNSSSGTTFCTGSWGKDFYLQYDVCPLALDELDSYFRAEKCPELIRERFKISDVVTSCSANEENCSATETLIQDNSNASSMGEGTIRNIDSSCSSPSDKELSHDHHDHLHGDDDDDDAGHHSVMCIPF
ncbi:uncharacterized protein PB18E9.04c-like [Lucilia sericata]|uniref:uncharacterized protein PB18E9.04c-like n=1 Tax=Lucilia sericata TaxID=13632 RepID=UPI0018A88335|nr:uncharacterized protein PB18E9.04c-like [Lucilia sericata]